MERFPPGAWDLTRPNVINWIADLARVEVSASLNRCRDLLFRLGQRIDTISRVTMHEEDDDDEEEEEVPMERAEQADAVGEALYMENETVVRPSLPFFFMNLERLTLDIDSVIVVQNVTCAANGGLNKASTFGANSASPSNKDVPTLIGTARKRKPS